MSTQKMSIEEIQKEFGSKDHMTQVTLVFAIALKRIFQSKQPLDVKTDGLRAAVSFYKSSVVTNTVKTLVKCHQDTDVPINIIISLLGEIFLEEEEIQFKQFQNMMALFDMEIS